jgi:protoheme IX farnesyltransferase
MKSKSGNRLKYFLEVSKLKIMLPVSLTAFTGYFICDPHFSFRILAISLGVLLLAISASVLNQIQEKDLDAKMKRTRRRPIPAGKISIRQAFIFFLITFFSGLAIILLTGNFKALIVSLITIVCYNGLYTSLKRMTSFAIIPGAIAGAMPPLIGWIVAGGGAWDKPIILFEFFLFSAQIPHFLVLLQKYREDYTNAAIPNLANVFKEDQVNRLTFIWVISSVVAGIFLCGFEVIRNRGIAVILLIASIFLICQFTNLVRNRSNEKNYARYSILLNSYYLLLLFLLISDRIMMPL